MFFFSKNHKCYLHHNSNLINRLTNIMPHILIPKFHPLRCLISIFSGFLQCISFCCDPQHPSAVGHYIPVLIELTSGMEYIIPVLAVKPVQAIYLISLFIMLRISVRCQNHTYGCIVLKLQLYLVQGFVHAGF